jgi:AraC family transcriptional regulator
MTKPLTTLDYSRRIERVVAYVGAHLDDPLDLERLAGVACFSPYHFHRIYRAMTGETAAETLRRLRLHRAAAELVGGRAPMTAIARRGGYGSVAAFARAFRGSYGVPPAAYRRAGRLVPPSTSTAEKDTSMYDVTIRRLEPVRLAALRHVGDYMEIGTVFERIFAWAAGRGLLGPQARSIGVYYDDPDAVPAKELRADAGIAVGSAVTVDGGLRIVEVPGGRHAVLRHQGPYAELHKAYRWLYREWLPRSGEDCADRPCFEEYLNNPRALPPEQWLTDICLPLEERR